MIVVDVVAGGGGGGGGGVSATCSAAVVVSLSYNCSEKSYQSSYKSIEIKNVLYGHDPEHQFQERDQFNGRIMT